ncbi:MAG: hypothetical protein KAY91_01605 [Rhodocyclaceae bacterium]|nr:hypothetical protein [Rhodocyclaceae bacterium]
MARQHSALVAGVVLALLYLHPPLRGALMHLEFRPQSARLRYSPADTHDPPYQLAAAVAVVVVVVLVAGSLARLVVVVAQVHPLLHRAQAGSLLAAAEQP